MARDNIISKVITGIIATLLVTGIVGMIKLQTDVSVQGATIDRNSTRIDTLEYEMKSFKQTMNDINTTNKEDHAYIKTKLDILIKTGPNTQ